MPAFLAGAALMATDFIVGRARESEARITEAKRFRLWTWAGWKQVLTRTYDEINDDRLLALAAGVVFYALLALFPAITALVSSYALFADPGTILSHLDKLSGLMPTAAFEIISEQVKNVVGTTKAGLSFAFLFGFAFALWSANAGVKAAIDALNIVYGVKERRSFLKLNLISLCFTVGAIGATLFAFAAIAVLPIAIKFIGYGNYTAWALWLLRWPALIVAVLLALAVLYRFGPDLDAPEWHVFTPGAVAATVLWLGGSAIFSYYLANFADYDSTYGSLGAGIGLMMWFWLSAIVVLVGAELNAVIDESKSGAPKAFPAAPPDRIGAL